MSQIKVWARYYVDWLARLGLIRFTLLAAACLILLALVIQLGVTLFLRGQVEQIDVIRSVFFGLLITPWAVYFMSIVVDQLEDSRQRLAAAVRKLEQMRSRDLELNDALQRNIDKLNKEIEVRQAAEEARELAIQDLENEVYQREKAQVELQERTVLLRSFIDCSPDLVYYRNENERFSGCNRAMEQLTGRSEHELIGLTPFDVYSEEVASKVVETDRAVFASNEPLTYEQWLQYPDGRKAYFELRKVPFFSVEGKRLGLLGFGRDITERKRYQDALEQASREKTTFISTISHELRTPLNGIVGLSRILLDGELNDTQRQHLRTIYLSAVTLGNIFNDIIDMDKLDRSGLEIVPSEIDFKEFLEELESLARMQAGQKGLKLRFHSQAELPDYIEADATRLRQVLWNLLGNAVKFTREGEVQIRVAVSLLDEQQARLCFEVEDTGIGIPADKLDKIFTMYYQVKEQQHATGTGIGLAVTRQLVEAMGGEVDVRSQAGKGSCFSVTLTVPVRQDTELREVQEDDYPALYILLVEDVELNITVACSLLEKLGHTVEVARTGREALEMVGNDDYDLIFLDIQLPDISGFEVASSLRREYGNSLPPLVALTANVINNKDEYIQRGMDDAISKPLASEAITRVVQRFFNQVETASQEPALPPAVSTAKENEVLDRDFLNQYLETVGVAVMQQSVGLFEQLMPGYLALLERHLAEQENGAVVEEAHKIKGAAASIGLKRIRQLAQQAQSPELPGWQEQIHGWVAAIHDGYQGDVEQLKQWLQQQG